MLLPRDKALRDLYAYWESKRAGRFAPPRSAIDPADIRRLLPIVVLLDVVGSPPRFRVRLAGTAVVQGYGREITGQYVDELDFASFDDAVLADLAAVVQHGRPNVASREYTRQDGRHVRYELLMLPLSSDGLTVDKLFGGVVVEYALGPARRRVSPAIFP